MAISTLTQRLAQYRGPTPSTDGRRLRRDATFSASVPLRMREAPTHSYSSSLTARQIPCYRKLTSAYVCAYASVSLMYVPMYLSILLSSVTAVISTVNIIIYSASTVYQGLKFNALIALWFPIANSIMPVQYKLLWRFIKVIKYVTRVIPSLHL